MQIAVGPAVGDDGGDHQEEAEDAGGPGELPVARQARPGELEEGEEDDRDHRGDGGGFTVAVVEQPSAAERGDGVGQDRGEAVAVGEPLQRQSQADDDRDDDDGREGVGRGVEAHHLVGEDLLLELLCLERVRGPPAVGEEGAALGLPVLSQLGQVGVAVVQAVRDVGQQQREAQGGGDAEPRPRAHELRRREHHRDRADRVADRHGGGEAVARPRHAGGCPDGEERERQEAQGGPEGIGLIEHPAAEEQEHRQAREQVEDQARGGPAAARGRRRAGLGLEGVGDGLHHQRPCRDEGEDEEEGDQSGAVPAGLLRRFGAEVGGAGHRVSW